MRGALSTGLVLALVAVGCGWEGPPPGTSARPPPDLPSAGPPTWVPPLTAQQTTLLTLTGKTIQAPAQRVFPDLARFGYANNRALASEEDAIKFTRMTLKVLNDSPRFYALDELPPGAENSISQYGPAPSPPDGFSIVKRDADGIGQLVPAPGAAEARAAMADAAELERQGQKDAALALYQDAVGKIPNVPALRVALGNANARAGRAREAEAAYRDSINVDRTFAPAHLSLAELAEQRGDRRGAQRHLAEALAYDAASPHGLALLRRLSSNEPAPQAPADGGWGEPAKAPPPRSEGASHRDPFPMFLDVDAAGAIHAVAGKSDAAQIYGGCRAVMRFEPSLRASIFEQPRETPYYLSVTEEVVCIEAGLGAYIADKRKAAAAPDAELERILHIAQEDGLSGFVMFEILGQHRPERARVAPPDVHKDTAAYINRWIFLQKDAIPEGRYTAAR